MGATDVPSSYVEATLSTVSRRLKGQQNRRLASGAVAVAYTITIPSSDTQRTASAITNTIGSTSTTALSGLLSSAVSNEGVSDITLSVTLIGTPVVTQTGKTTSDSLARKQVAFASVHALLLA